MRQHAFKCDKCVDETVARVVRRTRSLVFMSADLVVGMRVVATAKGVWKIVT